MTSNIVSVVSTVLTAIVIWRTEKRLIPGCDPFEIRSIKLYWRWHYSHLIVLCLCSYFPPLVLAYPGFLAWSLLVFWPFLQKIKSQEEHKFIMHMLSVFQKSHDGCPSGWICSQMGLVSDEEGDRCLNCVECWAARR